MVQRNVIVGTQGGLRVGIASCIAAVAKNSSEKVLLALTTDPLYQIDASELMAVLSLGVAVGESLTITCNGARAEGTVNAVTALLLKG